MTARSDLLDTIVAAIPRPPSRCCLVGIDGPDGAGKTVFADALADAVRAAGRPGVRVSCDDFHHQRAVRYRRGRGSPLGYWLDSFDHRRFVADVLEPLRLDERPSLRDRAHDLESDAVLDPPWQPVPVGAVAVVDGVFLHRDEFAWAWDFSVFLDVPFAVTAARMAARDGTHPDPAHPTMRRYVEGQRLYFNACRPRERASLVVNNTDVDSPFESS